MNKNFKVEIWFSRALRTSVILAAANPAHAITIAKQAYPNARVVSAREVK